MTSKSLAGTPYHFSVDGMPHAKTFMEALEEEILLSGAFGAGKSRTGCEKGYLLSQKYPGNRGLVIRKTYASLRNTTLWTWRNFVCPPNRIKSFNQETHSMMLDNGSEILWLGMHDDPSRIGSLEVGWIFLDEAAEFDEEDYDMLLGRLRLSTVPIRQIFGATNPGPPTHFLYERFFLENEPSRKVIEANSFDNPHTPQDYKDRLSRLKGINYERFVLGKWVGFEGLVYDKVDIRHIIIDPFNIPPNWPRYAGIDFGYTNPFVHQWWARCPDGEETDDILDNDGNILSCGRRGWYLYREIYYSKRTVNEHAALINTFDEPMALSIADWDAEDRATLEEHGIYTIQANKEVGPGIQTVYGQFEQDRIHIFRDCTVNRDDTLREQRRPTSTAGEIPNYRWAKLSEDKNIKEVPVDRDNHGMDSKRYVIHTIETMNYALNSHHKKQRNNWHRDRDWRGLLVRDRRYRSLG